MPINISIFSTINTCKINVMMTCVFLLILTGCQQSDVMVPEAAWSKNSQGVGQMGTFDYESAYATFADLHNKYPKQRIFHHNLIIATLNRQQPSDEADALTQLHELFKQDDSDLVTRYLMGILQFNQGDCDQAKSHFSWIAKADPSDAYARYFLGQCLLQQGEFSPAYKYFESAIEIDPYLRSAYYGAFMTAQRLNQTDKAEAQLIKYQQMEINPQSRLAEIKYTRMGPKAMARVNQSNDVKTIQLPVLSDPFNSGNQISKSFKTNNFTSVYQFEQELWVASDGGVNVYKLTPTSLELDRQITAVGMKVNDQISVTDINQDGLLDGYVTGTGHIDRIYINHENEKWKLLESPIPDQSLPQSETVQFADLDHDGDLDVLTIDSQQQVHLINNNGNLSFRFITEELLSNEQNHDIIDTALVDIDGDRDLDILLLQEGKLMVIVNDRMWHYQVHYFNLAFNARQIVVNYDMTGQALIHVTDDSNTIHQAIYGIHDSELNWKAHQSEMSFEVFELSDVNGDGQDDWLLFDTKKISILDPSNYAVIQTLEFAKPQIDFYILAGLNGPEILTTTTDSLTYWPASSNRHRFLMLSFTGRELAADSMRSNALGIGTEIVVHNNQQAKKQLYLSQSHHNHHSFGAMNVAAFMPNSSNLESIDFMALQWSDGVYQTELGLKPGINHQITETQRQLSSCPVLFMNQNGKFEFLTDVMGVGATGFLVARDQFATPRDWEFLLLDQGMVDDSDLSFLVTEPMEETMFMDAVKFKMYETDLGINAVLDERMATNGNQPSGELMFYSERWFPEQIISQGDTDSTAHNLEIDGNPLPVGELDLRFLGHLKQQQIHIMTFKEPLQGELILMANGWVEYGYSQTSFAAWQAGQSLQYPSLDAEIDGQWVTLLEAWGFPAGMPKMAAIEFSIPDDKMVTKLRLRSNQEVYFDQISVAKRINPKVTATELPLLSARQSVVGFPLRENGPHRFPLYDFSQSQPFYDTRHMAGAYTQLGPVEPLVSNKDNAIAIVSGGEGVTFQFAKPTDQPNSNKQRFFVMEFYGWAKDMDIMTQYGNSLTPLPHTGEVSAAAKALNELYNVRFMSGH